MSVSFVLVTGATSGLGKNTVVELARRGVPVIVGGRREAAVDALAKELRSRFGVETRSFVADLADLSAVRRGLAALSDVDLQAVVTNAGLTTAADARTREGFEVTFGVNVLAHQVVIRTLLPQIQSNGRIVVLSSGVHEPDNQLARRAGIPVPRWVGTRALARPDHAAPEDVLEPGPLRYSTSKLGNVLQARGWQRHCRASGLDVDVFAVDPGLMVDTQLAREIPALLRPVLRGLGYALTPFVGNMRLSTTTARVIASMATDDSYHGRGFQYFDGEHPKDPSPDALRDDWMDDLWEGAAELLAG